MSVDLDPQQSSLSCCPSSWGSYWGENGFFKLKRGVNNLMIESECAWAVPHKNWKDDMFEENDEVVRDTSLSEDQ